jgi:hypothetical protein
VAMLDCRILSDVDGPQRTPALASSDALVNE